WRTSSPPCTRRLESIGARRFATHLRDAIIPTSIRSGRTATFLRMTSRLFTASLLLTASVLATPPPGMVFIPGGEFFRGRSQALSDDNLKWYPTLMKDDRPVRPIRIDPFYLDQHEVTNGQ